LASSSSYATQVIFNQQLNFWPMHAYYITQLQAYENI
jgi:hypothetical protein